MRSVVAVGLVLSFAALFTLHLTLVWRLLFRAPRWLSLLALVPPLWPLCPYWAHQNGLKKSALLWALLLLLYAAMLASAYAVGTGG